MANLAREAADAATEVADQATEVAIMARDAAVEAKELTTCQFTSSILHHLPSSHVSPI
jgi:hypothetical protein